MPRAFNDDHVSGPVRACYRSKKPWPISSDTATTPERAKLEMWLTPENGCQGSSGTMLASPAMPASETAAPKLDVRRRSRNGSSRQSRMSSGTATIAAAASAGRRSGNMVNRNATVSASTTSTSKKLKVISKGEHDHAHDHHQRQRRRHGRAAKQDEPEKIEEGPSQQRQRRRKRTVLGQADGEQRRRVDGRD